MERYGDLLLRRPEMSDQVIFTKEEVEKIRNAVHVVQKTFEILKLDTIKQIPIEALALLDSPRPRPKVKLETVYGLINLHWNNTGELERSAIRYLNLCGFDVED
jgi:hypothetical protein